MAPVRRVPCVRGTASAAGTCRGFAPDGAVFSWRCFGQRGFVGICARQRSNFLLLRQKKVTKEKASRSQSRCAVPCAARTGRGRAKLALRAQTDARPDPPAAPLLSSAPRRSPNSQSPNTHEPKSLGSESQVSPNTGTSESLWSAIWVFGLRLLDVWLSGLRRYSETRSAGADGSGRASV